LHDPLQGRDRAKRSLSWTRLGHSAGRKIWVGQGFASRLVTWASDIPRRDLDILRKPEGQRGFQV
jgi:hypothetical protein